MSASSPAPPAPHPPGRAGRIARPAARVAGSVRGLAGSVRGLAGAAAPAGAATVLAAGAAGAPALAAVAVAGVLGALGPGCRLVRLALRIHAAHRSYGPCRGAGFLGVAVLCGGLTAAVLPLGPLAWRLPVTAGGSLLTIVCYVLGLLLLPGAAPGAVARLRRAFDGLSIGVSLAFTAWLMLPHGRGMHPLGYVVTLVAVSALSIVVLTVLRAVRHRPASVLCGLAAGLATAGLTVLSVLLAAAVPGTAPPATGALLAAALPLAVAPSLAWAGARRWDTAPAPATPAQADGTFTEFPLLTVPAGMCGGAALWHMVTVGSFDRPSVVLGVGVLTAMAAREVLAAVDLRRYARRLTDQEAHFRSLVAGSSDVTMVLDTDLAVRWQSPAAARQLGLSDLDVLGQPFTGLVHPDDAAEVDRQLRCVLAGDGKDAAAAPPVLVLARIRDGFGQWRDTESTVSDLRATPAVASLVVHLRDVGERRQLERTLQRLALTDQLTGLPNRRQLLRALARLRAVTGGGGAVLTLDLHGMAGVNELRGREVGDAVLVEVARRLRGGAGPDDLPARLGGDEFAVVTAGGPIQAYALGIRLLNALTEPYLLPGATVHLAASVGLAELAPGEGVDDLLNRADLARRRARQLGRNRVEWYDESIESLLRRRMLLERDLPGAALRGELDLVYQPVLELAGQRPVGVEALLRWRHPTLGTVPPGELVPMADELGVMSEVGDWVLRAASRQLAGWLADGLDLWVAVNVSLRQLTAANFAATVAAAMNAYQVPADRLLVEVAESAVGADVPAAVARLTELRSLGVRTALDHFGTGPTSLAYLRQVPADLLKMDSALFAEPEGRPGLAVPIVDVVVSLGRRLGLAIVAEGIEHDSQLHLVRQAGCHYGQGRLFGWPAPAERVEAFLEPYRAASG
ncbi:MAG TPA: EAL domain-containing protein [Micromonosporaceae bacterium]|nr:EAL domain-containing protein [Micromonosporaceae bacterium]